MDMRLSKLWETVKDRKPGALLSMGSQRVRHDLVTEQQQGHVFRGWTIDCIIQGPMHPGFWGRSASGGIWEVLVGGGRQGERSCSYDDQVSNLNISRKEASFSSGWHQGSPWSRAAGLAGSQCPGILLLSLQNRRQWLHTLLLPQDYTSASVLISIHSPSRKLIWMDLFQWTSASCRTLTTQVIFIY